MTRPSSSKQKYHSPRRKFAHAADAPQTPSIPITVITPTPPSLPPPIVQTAARDRIRPTTRSEVQRSSADLDASAPRCRHGIAADTASPPPHPPFRPSPAPRPPSSPFAHPAQPTLRQLQVQDPYCQRLAFTPGIPGSSNPPAPSVSSRAALEQQLRRTPRRLRPNGANAPRRFRRSRSQRRLCFCVKKINYQLPAYRRFEIPASPLAAQSEQREERGVGLGSSLGAGPGARARYESSTRFVRR
ncbi:hypothetical protein R3P38DRAFT_3421372 [Favolaschia claudopus]|uniref:Uncharacterized protein n=1 Tax=Favolaschia claudopus TaxID=2862362 RepID=A0AAW0D6M6_9AGAR